MKKLSVLLVVLAVLFALSACGGSSSTDSKAPEKETTTPKPTAPSQIPMVTEQSFKQTATIEETVLVDENGIKVTATNLSYTNYSAKIELTIENNSDEDITLMSGTLGYSCNSVNGIMSSGGYVHCDVTAGKKAIEDLSFNYDDLLLYGIDEIADVEIGFYSSNENDDYTFYPVSQIKTSIADSYNYKGINCYNTLTSREMQSAHNYNIVYSAKDKLYDVNGVSLISEIMFKNRDDDPILLIEAVNDTGDQCRVIVNDIYINGITVNDSRWTSEIVNPSKKAFIDIDLSLVFNKIYWELYGINEIKNIQIGISQIKLPQDNSNKETTPETIEIPVKKGKVTVDTSGTVPYNKDGVRVISKGFAGGTYDSDKSLYLMLLIENTSGDTLWIDADDVSINGIMADSIAFGQYFGNGNSSIWKVEIMERALEKCDIKDASDIMEIEFTLSITDQDWNKKEEAISIVFA